MSITARVNVLANNKRSLSSKAEVGEYVLVECV